MAVSKRKLSIDALQHPLPPEPEAPKPVYKIPADGRPTTYTPELADYICGELAGGKSLRSILGKDGMPARRTIFYWLRKHEEFLRQYTRAKEESADALADDIHYVASKTLDNFYDPTSARVAIDAYKWTASKLKPKRYGDKLELENNVKHSLADKDEAELNKLVQDYLNGNKSDETA